MAFVPERKFRVDGIHCAGCVARIRGAVERLPGVDAVGLGLEGDLLVRGRVEAEDVRGSIVELGFTVSDELDVDARSDVFSASVGDRGEKRLMVTAAALSLPLVGGTMLTHLAGIHASSWTEGWGAAVLSGGVIFGCGWGRWVSAVRSLLDRSLSMDVTVMLGGLTAWLVSIHGMSSGGRVYFEAAAGIVVVQMFGRWLESRLRRRAGDALRELGCLQPQRASLSDAGGGGSVDVRAVKIGDRFMVRAGERVPLDGVVVSGESNIDLAWLTGESAPRRLMPGVEVVSGALNLGGEITVRCTETVRTGMLARMAALMRAAEAEGVQGQGWIDRWVARFSVGLFGVAVLSGLGWHFLGHHPWDWSLLRAATVLVSGCPCALGLAVPMIHRVAVGAGLRRGLLISHAGRLSRLARSTDLIFDKTGTLTLPARGVPEVELAVGVKERDFWANAAGVEGDSRHPFAEAVRDCARVRGAERVEFSGVRELPGEGVEGWRNGSLWRFIRDEKGWSRMEAGGAFLGRVRFPEQVQDGAADAVRALMGLGVRVHLASGDTVSKVLATGHLVGIPPEQCHGGMRPEDKVALCRKVRETGGVVVMVGDGVNDAAVLGGADVGIAVSGASGVARSSAHIELLRSGLDGILDAYDLGRMVEVALRQNLGFAVGYNLLTVPIAAGAFLDVFGWDFTPMQASLAMGASSLSVVLNALWWGRRFGSSKKT